MSIAYIAATAIFEMGTDRVNSPRAISCSGVCRILCSARGSEVRANRTASPRLASSFENANHLPDIMQMSVSASKS